VKLWADSIFKNWDFFYFVLIDNCLIKIPLPRQIKYNNYQFLYDVQIHKLENFTILK